MLPCRGHGFDPWVEDGDPACCTQHGQKIKKQKVKKKKKQGDENHKNFASHSCRPPAPPPFLHSCLLHNFKKGSTIAMSPPSPSILSWIHSLAFVSTAPQKQLSSKSQWAPCDQIQWSISCPHSIYPINGIWPNCSFPFLKTPSSFLSLGTTLC